MSIDTARSLALIAAQDFTLLTLSWDKNWDSHSLVNGYPRFYPRIALVAPSPEGLGGLHLEVWYKQMPAMGGQVDHWTRITFFRSEDWPLGPGVAGAGCVC